MRCLPVCFALWAVAADLSAQEPASDPQAPTDKAEVAESVPETVEVTPVASDRQIEERLRGIMEATSWFDGGTVRVEDGVVFLAGEAISEIRREWLTALVRRTESVTAVVNNMTVAEPDLFDVAPAMAEIRDLGRQTILMLPKLGIAFLILIATYPLAKLAKTIGRRILDRRVNAQLLRQVLANVFAVPVVLIGIYLALRVSGLTQLAATVVGGTGLFGLVVGIAFRDIAENFLASLLISMNRPFAIGDLVEIEGKLGFVQSVTTRGTTLMTFEGNHIQIPNATIYKATVKNITANPNQRQDFIVGIDYGDDPTAAQEKIVEILERNEFVLSEPAPMVLVDQLAASTINLKVFFWIDGSNHSVVKGRSTLMKQVLADLDDAGFSFPDGDREVVFPQGVPVRMLRDEPPTIGDGQKPHHDDRQSEDHHQPPHRSARAVAGEEDLSSERRDIERQAAASRSASAGEEILVD